MYKTSIIGTIDVNSKALVKILKQHFYNKTGTIISNIAVEIGNVENNRCLLSNSGSDGGRATYIIVASVSCSIIGLLLVLVGIALSIIFFKKTHKPSW